MKQPASFVAGWFLMIIAVGHLLRLILNVHVVADGIEIPVWLSFPAMILTGFLAFWLFRERRA